VITVAAFIAVCTAALVTLALIAAMLFNRLMALLIEMAFTIAFIMVAYPSSEESALGLAIAIYIISTLVGWQALNGERPHRFFRLQAEALAARWGTKLRYANLTGAEFSGARIRSTDFQGAVLTRTHWNEQMELMEQMTVS
jgi:hypothetical protein